MIAPAYYTEELDSTDYGPSLDAPELALYEEEYSVLDAQFDPAASPTPSRTPGGRTRRGGRASAKSDCAWCRYGKPAALGAAVGAGLTLVFGGSALGGALLGAGSGLAFGQVRG